VDVIRSSAAGEQLAEIGSVAMARGADPARAGVYVDPGRRFQTFEGFGGAFTEAAALTVAALEHGVRDEVLAAYFDAARGHGYRFCRTHINSCDFAAGEYTYVEPGDASLASFSIEHDKSHIVPFINAANEIAGGRLRLLASPWSPPGWMKTNGQMLGGGKLLPEYRDTWAQYFCRYIEEYAREGIEIWGVSVQNEPEASQRWESCLYSAEEERDFVRDHLGPALERAGLGHVAIVIWDHNRDGIVERASIVLGDPEAARFVWGTGFHWYGGDNYENVARVHDAFPDKKLLLTEACQENGTHHGSWELAERYAAAIVSDLNHWAVGWIDWNLVLDERGGPNHAGNYCSAPVIVDRALGEIHYESSYAAIGQFARYVRPGSTRILCGSSRDELEVTAFDDGAGGLAVVALNRTAACIPFDLRLDGQSAPLESPARSISTFLVSP
jgi:glucosylceramidase